MIGTCDICKRTLKGIYYKVSKFNPEKNEVTYLFICDSDDCFTRFERDY